MKKVTALVLVLALALGTLPMTAWGAEPDGAEGVTVRMSFYDGATTQSFLLPPQEMTVRPGTATDAGYTTLQLVERADQVTVFDALVAVHTCILGGGEPVDPAALQEMLSISQAGSLTRVMGEGGVYGPAFGFAVNGVTPNDGVYNELYQSYTGYTADQSVLQDGDVVEFFFYEDTDAYSDFYVTLEPREAMVYVDQPLDITASGYMIGWYGCSTPETILERTLPLAEAQLAIVDETGAPTPVPDAVTDEAGRATVHFDRPGRYSLSLSSQADYVIAPQLALTVAERPATSITVPSDATVSVGRQLQPYQPLEEMAHLLSTTDEATGTATYYYDWTGSGTFYYRITGDFIPYGGILTKGKAVTVTEEQLKPQGMTRTTVERDMAANNGFNVADLYLNIDPRGQLELESGDTYQLVHLRNWQAVNTTTANRFMEPDYHYTVLDENGQASGAVVEISESGLLTAKAEGTAIVLVTYDAMHYADGVGGPFFGAIWPENTGVFVVTVGGSGSDIDTGMTLNPGRNTAAVKCSGDALDAELDVIYFTGEAGSYTFTPGTQGCEVWVANPSVDKEMTFTGFAPVQANADGSFTVPLTQGRNIVKLVQGEQRAYQVITAKQLTITVNDGKPVRPGDALTITFDTLYQPNKLAKLYNGVAGALYTTPEGKLAGSVEGGNTGSYVVADYQSMSTYVTKEKTSSSWGDQVNYVKGETLTVPKDYNKDTYTLTGGVMAVLGNAYCGEYGLHREITLTGDTPAPKSTAVKDAVLGRLPDIEIPITRETSGGGGRDQITVTFTLLGDQVHGTPTQATGTHTKKANNLETWLERTQVKVPRDATVLDVVGKALDQANIPYENPDGTYITSIRGLAELSNGNRSGWKYTLNGKYPALSVARQSVKEGDDIIFHYTDDFHVDDNAPTTSTPSHSSGGSSGRRPSATEPVQEPTTAPEPVRFEDVPADHWARQAVDFVSSHGLFQGTDTHSFSPAMPMSRAMLVTVLYRMAGASAVQDTCAFPDVAADAWYTDAVIWASGAGIVTGDEAGFAPDRAITRQELAVMLYRYAQRMDSAGEEFGKLDDFTDAKQVAPWATTAMAWAVDTGLLHGRTGGTLAPTGVASRAEVAVILERMAARLEH